MTDRSPKETTQPKVIQVGKSQIKKVSSRAASYIYILSIQLPLIPPSLLTTQDTSTALMLLTPWATISTTHSHHIQHLPHRIKRGTQRR